MLRGGEESYPSKYVSPQVVETNPPQPMDAVGEGSLYDGLIVGIPAWNYSGVETLKSGWFFGG